MNTQTVVDVLQSLAIICLAIALVKSLSKKKESISPVQLKYAKKLLKRKSYEK